MQVKLEKPLDYNKSVSTTKQACVNQHVATPSEDRLAHDDAHKVSSSSESSDEAEVYSSAMSSPPESQMASCKMQMRHEYANLPISLHGIGYRDSSSYLTSVMPPSSLYAQHQQQLYQGSLAPPYTTPSISTASHITPFCAGYSCQPPPSTISFPFHSVPERHYSFNHINSSNSTHNSSGELPISLQPSSCNYYPHHHLQSNFNNPSVLSSNYVSSSPNSLSRLSQPFANTML